ncbi:MAG TPA: transglycosylase domain-containing protein [Xanthobacteraceae bacterium]|nr:transglycosylase domain-containing protein [Xanthobacteraceae bacterium]
MDAILVKLLAAFLTLSLVTTRPDAIKTHFDPARDQAEVTRILRDGCAHMRKAFDVESIDIDDLIKTAMDDPEAISTEIKALHGLKFDSLLTVYRQFCKNEDAKSPLVDLAEVIRFYNGAVADLPDPGRLKGANIAGAGGILDARGERFADLTENNRRIWVPLRDIPAHVQKAFIAAEDKRFYEHKGVDERGLVRAMVSNLARPGRPQGGSTITQQVVKNLLVGDDVTYERKMREIIVASRVERTLSKSDILELYLNSIYLGRGSWGVELAARNYFGKPAAALTLQEGAMLAGLPKGPTYYSPDRHPDRAQERLAYVVSRMQEDGVAVATAIDKAKISLPQMVAYSQAQQRDSGYYFLDHVTREARSLTGIGPLTTAGTTVRTTIRPDLQRATEVALQEGLAQYEIRTGRTGWHGPEANLSDAVRRIEASMSKAAPETPATVDVKPAVAARGSAVPPDVGTKASRGTNAGKLAPGPGLSGPKAAAAPPGIVGPMPLTPTAPPVVKPKPAWQEALEAAHLPLYDVHWSTAIVLSNAGDRNGVRVGLADGRIMPLSSAGLAGRRGLNLYDVVFVKVSEPKGKQVRVDLRVRPTVQGAAVILDNKTGGILAMTGGFSYPVSQLNRVTQAVRQPGSSLKPFTYLAALRRGLQPNTLVRDQPLTLPPIGNSANARERDYWSPKNADGYGGGITTLRRGLENSKNLVTANLLDGGIDSDPGQSLSRVCELTIDAQVYRECVAYYPFILGAQPARLIDMAAFYAAIATEGRRPSPYSIEAIDQNGRTVYTHTPELKWLASGDRPSFFQLRTMLQGVVARGTARAIGYLSSYVGGKTGTSDDENDAWFVGFTNDVTIGVWVGYDNAEGKRRTLGNGQTGGRIAVPIFEQIVEATWATYARKTPLNPPSPDAKKELVAMQIDLNSGTPLSERSPQGFTEYFRLRHGQVEETQYALVSPNEVATDELGDGEAYLRDPNAGDRGYYAGGQPGGGYYYTQRPNTNGFFGLFGLFAPPQRQFFPPPPSSSPYGGYGDLRSRSAEDRRWAPPRRVDPDVPWRDHQRGDF